jgi:hypothetical protein
LADETGGQLYIASSEKDFPAIFAAMERQIRTQYYVSFSPERPTPAFAISASRLQAVET